LPNSPRREFPGTSPNKASRLDLRRRETGAITGRNSGGKKKAGECGFEKRKEEAGRFDTG